MNARKPVILVHGGAGTGVMNAAEEACLRDALAQGYAELERGAPAVRAVEIAIRVLEGSGLFNAGAGSVLQLDGGRRMDASLMDGRDLRAGAVAAVEGSRYPITVARHVMDETDHVLLAGKPATRFARYCRIERQAPPTAAARKAALAGARKLAFASKSWSLLQKMQRAGRLQAACETVGAVALDQEGNLAAGASTGGAGLMLPGRVGDTPQVGSGVYADNEGGAVSMTGRGEAIIRIAVAKEIVDRMEAGAIPNRALQFVLRKLADRINGTAGALVLAPNGRFAIAHTTPRMSAGHWTGKGRPIIADRFR
ncbi:MAG: isoaspartyl peptidase/L-asparaginase [Nitrospirae bacterium]|nr:isoaspartyl peptidase/L-asparaginase [Nitrospirota bacterium]